MPGSFCANAPQPMLADVGRRREDPAVAGQVDAVEEQHDAVGQALDAVEVDARGMLDRRLVRQQAAGPQQLRLRAGREHDRGRVDDERRVGRHARVRVVRLDADDLRRLEVGGSGGQRVLEQQRVEREPRQHDQVRRAVRSIASEAHREFDGLAVDADAADVDAAAREARAGHAVEHPDPREHACAARRDAVAARLVAREARAVDEGHRQAEAREQERGRRPRRTGADDADVERARGIGRR